MEKTTSPKPDKVEKDEPAKDESEAKEAAIETIAPAQAPAPAAPAPDPLRDLLAEDLRDTLLEKIADPVMRQKVLDQIKDDPVLDQIKFVKKWTKVQPAPIAAGVLPAPGQTAAPKSIFDQGYSPWTMKDGKYSYTGPGGS